jgi:hypothetical protein
MYSYLGFLLDKVALGTDLFLYLSSHLSIIIALMRLQVPGDVQEVLRLKSDAGKRFSLLQNVQTLSGVHPALYLLVTGVIFWGTGAGVW